MGAGERVGELRAQSIEAELAQVGMRLDTQKRYINLQGKAIEELGGICAGMQGDGTSLAARVEELEVELSYRLLPVWRRAYIQVRYAAGYALGWLQGLRARFAALRARLMAGAGLVVDPTDPADLDPPVEAVDAEAFQDDAAEQVRPWPPNRTTH